MADDHQLQIVESVRSPQIFASIAPQPNDGGLNNRGTKGFDEGGDWTALVAPSLTMQTSGEGEGGENDRSGSGPGISAVGPAEPILGPPPSDVPSTIVIDLVEVKNNAPPLPANPPANCVWKVRQSK